MHPREFISEIAVYIDTNTQWQGIRHKYIPKLYVEPGVTRSRRWRGPSQGSEAFFADSKAQRLSREIR